MNVILALLLVINALTIGWALGALEIVSAVTVPGIGPVMLVAAAALAAATLLIAFAKAKP